MNSNKNAFGSRVPLIGRQDKMEQIWGTLQAAAKNPQKNYVLILKGNGGTGKTRILEEVRDHHPDSAPFYVNANLIDFYDADYHHPENLCQAIAESLHHEESGNTSFAKFFETLHKLRVDFPRSGFSRVTLQENLYEHFFEGYATFAEKHVIVLLFDTVENLDFEKDKVQKFCKGIANALVKDWLLKNLHRFPHTVMLIAGRPESEPHVTSRRPTRDDENLYAALGRKAQQHENIVVEDLSTLEPFNNIEDIQSYLSYNVEKHKAQYPVIEGILEVAERVKILSRGEPMYLALCVDLYRHGWEGLFHTPKTPDRTIFEIAIHEMLRVGDSNKHVSSLLPSLITLLGVARKGLSRELAHFLVGTTINRENLNQAYEELSTFAIVKTRKDRLFLHDEVYRLLDLDPQQRDDPFLVLQAQNDGDLQKIIEYYSLKLRSLSQELNAPVKQLPQSPKEEDSQKWNAYEVAVTESLFYRLWQNPKEGYEHYQRRDAEAISSHLLTLDMALRNELLRFTARWIPRDKPIISQHIHELLPRKHLDQECALRWIARHLAHYNFQTGFDVARNIYKEGHKLLDTKSPFFQAGLNILLAETTIRVSKHVLEEIDPFKLLNEAIHLLDHISDDTSGHRKMWLKSRAYFTYAEVSLAHANYADSAYYYEQAIREIEEIILLEAQEHNADLHLNPHDLVMAHYKRAYVLSQLRDLDQAQKALELANQLDPSRFAQPYTSKLSDVYEVYITIYQGLEVHRDSLDKQKDVFAKACDQARKLIAQVNLSNDWRLAGLAHLVAGIAYRKYGESWKIISSNAHRQTASRFKRSEQYLKRAKGFFKKQKDPYRQCEIERELSSLYQDWGYWLWHNNKPVNDYTRKYELAEGYADKAIKIATAYHLDYALADVLENKAQIASDHRHILLNARKSNPTSFTAVQKAELDERNQEIKSYFDDIQRLLGLSDWASINELPSDHGNWATRIVGKVYAQQAKRLIRDVTDGLDPRSTPQENFEQVTEGLRLLYYAHHQFCSFSPKDSTNLPVRQRYLTEFYRNWGQEQGGWSIFLRPLEEMLNQKADLKLDDIKGWLEGQIRQEADI
jgi:hypothetical protein